MKAALPGEGCTLETADAAVARHVQQRRACSAAARGGRWSLTAVFVRTVRRLCSEGRCTGRRAEVAAEAVAEAGAGTEPEVEAEAAPFTSEMALRCQHETLQTAALFLGSC